MVTLATQLYALGEKRPRRDFRLGMFTLIALLHLGAVLPIIWHVWQGTWPEAKVTITATMLYVFTIFFGISLGYHRLFTHTGYKCPGWFRAILLVAGGMSLQGDAKKWVSEHRLHHAYADRPGDPHSPYQYKGVKGMMWAHMAWLFYKYELPDNYNPEDLRKDRLIQLQAKWNWVLVIASLAIPFAIAGWDGLFVAGFLRVVVSLHVTWCINSITHLWGERVAVTIYKGSEKIFYPSDGSRHTKWFGLLTLITFGESNHGTHHLSQETAFHGWRWYDVDPSKWMLCFLELIGVAREIKRPPPHKFLKVVQLKLPKDSFLWARQPKPSTV